MNNVAASVHQRLLNHARATGRVFNEVLQHYALERFLYRLGASQHRGSFVLKGALMFSVWHAAHARPTRDIDLLGRTANDPDHVAALIKDICRIPCELDGMLYDTAAMSAERIIEGASYAGVRVRFSARLGNARIPMQIDVGFGDALVPGPTSVSYPGPLDVPSADILGYSIESAIAEKLQVMVALGELNSRLKDYHDIWLAAGQMTLDGKSLSVAIKATFERRGTPIAWPTAAFSPRYAQNHASGWTAFVRRSGETEAPSIASATHQITCFLRPVVDALARGEGFSGTWLPAGPWR